MPEQLHLFETFEPAGAFRRRRKGEARKIPLTSEQWAELQALANLSLPARAASSHAEELQLPSNLLRLRPIASALVSRLQKGHAPVE